MKTIQFGLARDYDGGRNCCADINETTVVEVHNSEVASDMWYHVGKVKGATVEWGGSIKYSNGNHPNIAINNKNIVVEVHETSNILTSSMYYKVGHVDGTNISWGNDEKYDSGLQPCVAINDNGVVVEVHKSQAYNELYYHVGQIQSNNTIKWGSSHKYDSGVQPSVSITNSGLVVETHKSQSYDKLYYRVGHISGNTINWGPSREYQDGINPSVAITEDGKVIEVHESQGLTGLWQLSGEVSGDTINWNESFNYDSGSSPKAGISSSGDIAIQVHQGSLYKLWFSTSALMDTANFMSAMLPGIQNLPLKKMVLPATHDAGMYTSGLSIVAKTQDLSLYGQLSSGARYFDLRPDKNLNIYHGPITGPSLQEVLNDVKRFYQEGHKELSILKFSHFDGFNQDVYNNFKTMIKNTIGQWLYTDKPQGTRLADITMGSYLSGGGKILVVVDDSWAVSYPESGFWVYRDWQSSTASQGDLTVFDIYSNTTSYENMKNDQLRKLNAFNGKCCSQQKNGSWECQTFSDVPCDLFLLSWTLTPVTGVWNYAKEANRNLGQVMTYVNPNSYGYFANLLYLDYFEYARPTFISTLLCKAYNNIMKAVAEEAV